MNLTEIHAKLKAAYDEVEALRGRLGVVRADTAFAIGEALGHLAKAKALVGRELDDEARRQ